jgi:DNA-binding beta-propeller fold protein YncE
VAYLYVVASEKQKIIQIAAESLVEEGSSPTAVVADGVEISKDGQRLFVTNRDDGTVSIIQIASGESSL